MGEGREGRDGCERERRSISVFVLVWVWVGVYFWERCSILVVVPNQVINIICKEACMNACTCMYIIM